ncbi:MAG: DEAD/DEAH box helicase [Acidobacteria bacterium]|nr:DEAD/DEAH box helicase [Acidobacteriota bacterium]
MSLASDSFFDNLALPKYLVKALAEVGYESPTPIQASAIPPLLEGKDLIGQAQTGTGKTAAFALPILSRINVKSAQTQALVLAPTRELAIQVSEAFQRYAAHLAGFHVAPIYGGQSYTLQLRSLRRGAHVVVGTPGRIMDHLRRGTLDLKHLNTLILDEADEMLRMGFIDDVTWILEQTPEHRQLALFSATMPKPIRRIADKHLQEPVEVTMKSQTAAADRIRQRYWVIAGVHKLDALTRVLEVEDYDGMIVFVRTKTATVQLTERLQARGIACAALNGDMAQALRERTIDRLKSGDLDVIVATDVAARGLDVERVSHVINYDIPYDTESYIHRIGRTGRAGRSGDAILFVAPRERRMLRDIERATRSTIDRMQMPNSDAVNNQRIERFKQRITDAMGDEQLHLFKRLLAQYQAETTVEPLDIAAALACLSHGSEPFLLPKDIEMTIPHETERRRSSTNVRYKGDWVSYRIDVGKEHGAMPKNIVGAIANEAGISSSNIGNIRIEKKTSTVDLPSDLPEGILKSMTKIRVAGRPLNIEIDVPNQFVSKRKMKTDKPPKKEFRSKDKPRDKPKKAKKAKKS